MANRINGNVIIVDSGMGNSLILTSANLVVNLDEVKVSAFAFWVADTTSNITLTHANTALDLVFKFDYVQGGTNGAILGPALHQFPFATPIRFGNLKVPRLTAGTGFIYLA